MICPVCYRYSYRVDAEPKKTRHLKLVRKATNADPREVLFMDYDPENLNQAMLEHYLTMAVDPEKGFDLATLGTVKPSENPDDYIPVMPIPEELTVPELLPEIKKKLFPQEVTQDPNGVELLSDQLPPSNQPAENEYLKIQHAINEYLRIGKPIDSLKQKMGSIFERGLRVIVVKPLHLDSEEAISQLKQQFMDVDEVRDLSKINPDLYKVSETLVITADIGELRQRLERKTLRYPMAVIDFKNNKLRKLKMTSLCTH